ncbi:MAG: hypothetical protein K8T10_05040 [Candidatus Eremiobacteraeota bacterium]|nr:hypothetical protein [Candidatus Eremiobacteraeota bacterium]
MKKRLMLLIIMVISLCGIANAQIMPGLSQYHQLFGYALAGLTVLLVGLLIWEIQFQISRRRGSDEDTMVNIIGVSEEGDGKDDEDPIKALLKAQAKSSLSQEDEEGVLPPFLQDDEKTSQSHPGTPPGAVPVAQAGDGGDPFKMLLMKSAHKEEEKIEEKPSVQSTPIPTPIPEQKPAQPHFQRAEDDPFKELLKSQEKKIVPPKPAGKKPGVKEVTPSAGPPRKKLAFTSPEPGSSKKKKIAFSIPSQKSAGGGLFSRISGSDEQQTDEPQKGVIKPPGPSKSPVSPETLERAINIDSGQKDRNVKIPDSNKVILKKPGVKSVQRHEPPRLKIRKRLEFDIGGKATAKAKDDQAPDTQKISKKGKRLTLDIQAKRGVRTSKSRVAQKSPVKTGPGNVKIKPKPPGKGNLGAPETKKFEQKKT